MKKINVFFEIDRNESDIEVMIRASERDGDVEALIDRISVKLSDLLTVTGADGSLIRVAQDDIVSVSVSGKTVRIVTEKERYSVRQPLQNIEDKLGSNKFVRISRYEIVNLDKVKKYDFTLGGTLRLELSGGMETWASRRNIPLIRKKLTGKD